jgi:hypothetical protein
MILAYLRNPDFIKPDYKYGIKSRLREELFIKAAALEFAKEINSCKILALGPILSSASIDARKELIEQVMDSLFKIQDTYAFTLGQERKNKVESSREKMVKVLELLDKKGLMSTDGFTPEKVHEIIKEYKENKYKK